MLSIQTNQTFSLSGAKPLDGILRYREYCLQATKKALAEGRNHRKYSPVTGGVVEEWGEIDGLSYVRCPKSGSLFLAELPSHERWASLLMEVSQYRQSSKAFHQDLKVPRAENVFQPKLDWIQNMLRVQNMHEISVLEVTTPPSDFSPFLKKGSGFKEILTVAEMSLVQGENSEKNSFQAALLLESLDRVDDPRGLLDHVRVCLKKDGLLFVTALVASGFDAAVLGSHNAYLFPPDRTNCFSLEGLKQLLEQSGFDLLEASTPGVLDVSIVKAHLEQNLNPPMSVFEQRLLNSGQDVLDDFQIFLQRCALSSFARLVGRKK